MVFVVQGEVVKNVLPALQHALDTVTHDDRYLVPEGGVVGTTGWHRGGVQQALTVLVLQALARERRASGGRAEQKAARLAVGRSPDQIGDTLKTEHGIEDV